jgi:hypothetical protein
MCGMGDLNIRDAVPPLSSIRAQAYNPRLDAEAAAPTGVIVISI